jgi:hypothetical protein
MMVPAAPATDARAITLPIPAQLTGLRGVVVMLSSYPPLPRHAKTRFQINWNRVNVDL